MDLSENVVNIIHNSIDSTMQSMDSMVPQIAKASEVLVRCLLSEQKIICCGEGQSGALSQIFASNLLNRFNHERPSLPAISLAADAATITAICGDSTFNEIFSRQIRAMGQPGDVLVIISNGSGSGTTLQAVQAAHDREMLILALCDRENTDISSLLGPEDLDLIIPHSNRARICEIQLLTLNCLCDLIDQQLFPAEEN